VNDHRLVTEERRAGGIGREESVRVLRDKRRGSDVAVLSGQVAHLAGVGRADVAGVVLAAVGGVEVAEGGGAVAVGGHGQGVDVVGKGAVGGLGGEAGEVDADGDAALALGRGDGDLAGDCGAGAVVD